jgi:hypothetical protein
MRSGSEPAFRPGGPGNITTGMRIIVLQDIRPQA